MGFSESAREKGNANEEAGSTAKAKAAEFVSRATHQILVVIELANSATFAFAVEAGESEFFCLFKV